MPALKMCLARITAPDDLTEVPRAQRRAPAKPLAAYARRHRDRHGGRLPLGAPLPCRYRPALWRTLQYGQSGDEP